MDEYKKKAIQNHYWLYQNGCYETLDIVCVGIKHHIYMILEFQKVTGRNTHTSTINRLYDSYRIGQYPKFNLPHVSLWKRIQDRLKLL